MPYAADHRGHQISILSRERPDRPGRYRPQHISLIHTASGGMKLLSMPAEYDFATEAIAGEAGLAYARGWIDRHLDGP